jgi:hypothetical protein
MIDRAGIKAGIGVFNAAWALGNVRKAHTPIFLKPRHMGELPQRQI